MKKSTILSAVIAGSAVWFSLHTATLATGELESEREEVAEQRSEVQSELSDAEQELADLMSEIEDIEKQIANIEDGLAANQEQMDLTEEEILLNEEKVEELQAEIDVLEADIEERFELLKSRASSYQRNGGAAVSYVEVILGSEDFGDFISRVLTITQIARADNDFIAALEEKQEELADVQEEFEDTLDELDEQMVELEGIEFYMIEQREEQENLIEQVEEHRADQEAMIAELESLDSELSAEEASLTQRIEAELQRQREEAERARQEAAAQAAREASSSNSTSSSNSSNSSSSSNNSGGGDTATATSGGSSSSSAASTSSSVSSSSGSSGSASAVINAGRHYIGNSTYKFGGGRSQSDINAGRFDCSGYVSWAFRQIGVSLPSSTSAMVHAGTRISASEMRPGDLVFFNTYTTNGHVGIYAGNGQFIGSQSSTGVAFANMNSGYWANAFNGVVVRVLH